MKTLNGLPVYKMTIDEFDEITGVEYLSLVDQPAIAVNWVAMSENKIKLYAASEDKQIVTGPAMIPNLPIYRVDKKLGEYYVSFDASEIEKIARKFNREQRTLGINYQHQPDSQVDSAVIIEQWFINDTNVDKAKTLGFDLPPGTWMVTAHFADKEFFKKEIRGNNVRGFSIEGYLNLQMSKIKNHKMNKIKMSEINTSEGLVLTTNNEAGFVEGAEVFINDAEGNPTPAPDGQYKLDNGTEITVAEGKITAVSNTDEAPTETEQSKFELTPEEIAVIGEALGIPALIKRIEDLEAAKAEMSSKFSNLPGSTTSATTKNDAPAIKTKMSLTDKLNAMRALKK